jgi:hypothetical protein
MVKRFFRGCVVALALVGLLGLIGGVQQAREDYSNFRKIVTWVAIKQQQEELARQQRTAKASPAPTQTAAPVTTAAPVSGEALTGTK